MLKENCLHMLESALCTVLYQAADRRHRIQLKAEHESAQKEESSVHDDVVDLENLPGSTPHLLSFKFMVWRWCVCITSFRQGMCVLLSANEVLLSGYAIAPQSYSLLHSPGRVFSFLELSRAASNCAARRG